MYPIARPFIKLSFFWDLFRPHFYLKDTISLFEKRFAEKFGRKFSCVFPSGRSGLYHLLCSLGISGKKIALSSYTCIVVPYAVEKSGNRNIFVEPANGSLTVSLEDLAKNSDVVISTHMFGQMAKGETKKEVLVIEDCCLALGSSNGDKKVGQIGDISFFSFNQSKQLSCLGGAIFLTDDGVIYEKLKKVQPRFGVSILNELGFVVKLFVNYIFYLRPVYHIFKKWFKYRSLDGFSLNVNDIDVGGNFLVGQAVVGLRQLSEIENILEKRREISQWYDTHLKDVDLKKPEIVAGVELSHYWVILDKDRDRVRKELFKRGVNTGIANEYSCPTTPYFVKENNPNNFVWTDYVGKHIINLPFYVGLKEKDVKKICQIFKQVYEHN